MKSILGRRIITLLAIAIIMTSALIAFLGLYLSEDVIAHIKSQAYIPDLVVLSNVTEAYMREDISEEIFRGIIKDSEASNNYIIYDKNGDIIYRTESFPKDIEERIYQSLNDVLAGDEFLERAGLETEPVTELLGIPIEDKGQVIGGIFALTGVMDLSKVNQRFYRSLYISIALVILFAILVARFVLTRITKPIRNVVSVALAMTEGDFSIEADETLEGEIGFLGKTLNKLSRDLYKNVSQLYIEKNRLDHVLNSLEEGMIAVDNSMNVTHINEAMIPMLGSDEKRALNKSITQIPLLRNQMETLALVLEGKRSISEKLEDKDIVYRLMIEPIENEKNRIVGAVILLRDITEIENLEQIRKNYVANVSHELRSPLTSIQGLIEPLMDNIVPKEADKQRYYKIIYQESRRLSRLVDDIMELSRLQMDNAMILREKIDLSPIFDRIYDRYKHYDDERTLSYDKKTLPKVISNGDRIEQVLVILLDNAFKYTRPGDSIHMKVEQREGFLEVSVKDTGVGISKEHLPYIFDRFYKVDKSRTKKSTGLGLSIAKEIVGIMGERIFCESIVDQGSTFTFTIALA